MGTLRESDTKKHRITKKGKKENPIRHTIMVFDGCAEEVAEYATKEDCLLVLYAIYKAIEQDAKCAELPKKEEMEGQKELIKQIMEAEKQIGNEIGDNAAEFLKGILEELEE